MPVYLWRICGERDIDILTDPITQDLLTIKIEKLAYGGDALGRLSDGRAVFIPFALPGETVRIRIVDAKRGRVRAELIDVLEPSADRISPRCSHFGICGGCHYQHLSYQNQLIMKTKILYEQLRRIGRLQNPPVSQMIPSSTGWNYRNHIQFHLTPNGKLGYIDANRRGIIPIHECHLPEPQLNNIWPALEFDPGLELERVSLRLGMDEESMLILESQDAPELELEANLSVVHLTNNDVIVMAGEDHLNMIVNDRVFRVSAASFFQVNSEMAGKIVAHVQAHLPVSLESTLLDAYCGVGLFSAFFAPRVGQVIGIESSPTACDDFMVNLADFDNVKIYEASAEQVLSALKEKPDIVVVDPPRAGLGKRVLDAILALGPLRIAYVSCDPSTLARDAALLINGGYRLVNVTPIDLFPQTASIESVSIFEKY